MADSPTRTGPGLLLLGLCGLLLEAMFVSIAAGARTDEAGPPTFLGMYLFAFLPYFVAVYLVPRLRSSWRTTALVFLLAGAFRATLLWAPPATSDDLYRYVWEGRIQLQGHNPFVDPPSAPELAYLRDELHARINHPGLTTIYLPPLQLLFAAIAALSPTPLAFKLFFAALDLLAGAFHGVALTRTGRHPSRALLHLWNPLLVVEFSLAGHCDAVGVFFVCGMIAASTLQRPSIASLCYVGSVFSKLATLLVLPAAVRASSRRWLWIGFLVGLAFCAPYAGAGRGLVSSLEAYASRWEFNASLFVLIHDGCRWIVERLGWDLPYDTFRLLPRGFVGALLVSWAIFEARRRSPFLQAGLSTLGLAILLSPVVHPWYLTWLVPFLVHSPRTPWLLLCASVPVSYMVLIPWKILGEWTLGPGWVLLEYLPFYGVLAWSLLQSRARGRSA